jgi:hypothetical protein
MVVYNYFYIFVLYINKKNDIIFIKQATAKQLGYLYEIWVYDNKGNKINCIE